jgi:hypothetical protein
MSDNLFQTDDLPARQRRRPRTVLMRSSDVIVLKELVHRTGYSDKMLRDVCRKFGIARQIRPNSPLEISWPAWIMLQHGDHDALEILREGRRDDPYLERYFREAGVPV